MSRYIVLIALVFLSACAEQKMPGMKIGKPYVIDGATYYPSYDSSYDKTGTASWYGPGFHGKYTASGEVYDQSDLTAAHPTLPMPSLVRVTNLGNGKSLIVRVNDRGPFKANRLIDLSKKSAEKLGIKGLAQVRVQFLEQETKNYISAVAGNNGRIIRMADYNDRIANRQLAEDLPQDGDTVQAAPAPPVMTVSSDEIVVSDTMPQPAQPAKTAAVKEKTPTREVTLYTSKGSPLVSDAMADDNLAASSAGDELLPREASPSAGSSSDDEPVTLAALYPPENAFSPPAPTMKSKPAAAKAESKGQYTIQAGAFSSENNAYQMAEKLASISTPLVEPMSRQDKSLWRVRVGSYASRTDAERALSKVRAAGAADAHVVIK